MDIKAIAEIAARYGWSAAIYDGEVCLYGFPGSEVLNVYERKGCVWVEYFYGGITIMQWHDESVVERVLKEHFGYSEIQKPLK